MPEVVEHRVTGFVCATLSEMIAAVAQVRTLDRTACRRRVEQLFSPAAMTDGYEQAYAAVVDGRVTAPFDIDRDRPAARVVA